MGGNVPRCEEHQNLTLDEDLSSSSSSSSSFEFLFEVNFNIAVGRMVLDVIPYSFDNTAESVLLHNIESRHVFYSLVNIILGADILGIYYSKQNLCLKSQNFKI